MTINSFTSFVSTVTATITPVSKLQKGDCFTVRDAVLENQSTIRETNARSGDRYGKKRYKNIHAVSSVPSFGIYLCLYCKVRGPNYVDLMVLNEHGLVKFIVGAKPSTLLKVLKPV